MSGLDPLQTFVTSPVRVGLPHSPEQEVVDHQATAQLLGNYGEFVGSIGALATLLYLAIQVRQSRESMDANTRAVKAQIGQARADNISAMMRDIVHSDHLARIGAERLAASDKGEWVNSLSPEDRYRWLVHLLSQFNDFRNQFYQYQQGLLDEEIWHTSTRGQIARVLGDPP